MTERRTSWNENTEYAWAADMVEKQIQYPNFQAQGWPIESEIVESCNKLVSEARMKGFGMHWAERHVNPRLALCNIGCSER
jgi:hypothetical protein